MSIARCGASRAVSTKSRAPWRSAIAVRDERAFQTAFRGRVWDDE
jgi:hypothetical protein